MTSSERPPAGPRGVVGAAAEDAAAHYLGQLGWTILARNLHLGTDEIDIVAVEPGRRPTLVIVEVRSRSGPHFGAAEESVDAPKVARLYRAALSLRRSGHAELSPGLTALPAWRVDLLTLVTDRAGGWTLGRHLRGLAPP